MRIPPHAEGHGGSQRAWHLVEALRPHGDIHFVLIFRNQDDDCRTVPLEPLAGRVRSVTRIEVPEWRWTVGRVGLRSLSQLWDLWRVGSAEAPVFSRRQVTAIAAQLPLAQPDMIFAGRLCCAVIAQSMMDAGLLAAPRKFADFDDVMSRFRWRQLPTLRRLGRAFGAIDALLIHRAERAVLRRWDAVSVCTDTDVAAIRRRNRAVRVTKVPNIAPRRRLPLRPPDGRCRLLFVGNLRFAANVGGLLAFIQDGWPALQAALPGATLTIVGMNPAPEIIAAAQQPGLALHANAPSLEPHYAACDMTIAPVLFGSGTRIKILEAMAYGRPIIATSIAAEGMGLVHGRHLLLADSMPGLAEAALALARDPALAAALAQAAYELQLSTFGPSAIAEAIADILSAPARPGTDATGFANAAFAV